MTQYFIYKRQPETGMYKRNWGAREGRGNNENRTSNVIAASF